jgi:hypothetical protein
VDWETIYQLTVFTSENGRSTRFELSFKDRESKQKYTHGGGIGFSSITRDIPHLV